MNIFSATQLIGYTSLSQALETHEALSGIFGSISLATWIFLLIPQLYLNFQLGSADGLAPLFIIVWFIGDVTNLAGAIWAGLVPTVILLAGYFCLSDIILLAQTLYYNHINAAKARQASVVSVVSEEEPLLTRRRSSENIGLPGSNRRRSSAIDHNTLGKIIEEEATQTKNSLRREILNVFGVVLVGTAGWFIAWKIGAWKPSYEGGVGNTNAQILQTPIGASFLGYFSAVCYLGARLPQIYKNHKERSCEGLALGFFLFSTLGNVTYGLGILLHSQEKEYIITNLPWLIGSLGTIAEDAIIFIQFKVYSSRNDADSAIEEE